MKNRLYKFFCYIGEYALYGMLFFIPISITFIETFSSFLIFGFIGRKIIKPDFKFIKSPPNIFLLLFLLFCALSLFNSGSYIVRISIPALFIKWIRYLLTCLIIQDGLYGDKIVRRGIFVFLSGAFLTVLSGLCQYFFGFDFLYHSQMAVMDCGWYAVTSFFNYYNDFGTYLAVVLSLTAALLSADNCFGLKAIGLLVFSMVASAVIMLTFSRGSWIAMFSSFVFIFIFGRKNLWRLIPVFLVIFAMLLIPQIRERLCLTFKVGGDVYRLKYWKVALQMIRDHPFLGIGLGTFMANFSKYLGCVGISYAHNCFLQIWAESGIFSLVSFMFFILSLFYIGIRMFIRSRDFLLLGLLSGALGFLVHSFFDTNLYSVQLAVMFWVWAGLSLRQISGAHNLNH